MGRTDICQYMIIYMLFADLDDLLRGLLVVVVLWCVLFYSGNCQ